MLNDEYAATLICSLLQVNSVETIGHTSLLKPAWVKLLVCADPVMNMRPACTAAFCRACCANKNIVDCRMAKITARKAGAIKANSTTVAPFCAARKRARISLRRSRYLVRVRNILDVSHPLAAARADLQTLLLIETH